MSQEELLLPASKEDPIPAAIWPDLAGVRTANVVPWNPTRQTFVSFCKAAAKQPLVSLDLETSGLSAFHGARLVGVAAAFYDGEAIQAGYWNFRHVGHPAHCKQPPRWQEAWPPAKHKHGKQCIELCPGHKEKADQVPIDALQHLQPILQGCIVAGQNFKFDIKMLSVEGLEPPQRVLDTMLIAHLYNENLRFYNLDSLAKEMGELKLGDTIKDYLKKHGLSPELGHAQVPHEIESPYAIRDTVLVLKRLQFERERWLKLQDPRLIEVLQIENGCIPAFARMEIAGIQLDIPFVRSAVEELKGDLAKLEAEAYALVGKKFDILSTDQLWLALEARGLKPVALTPTGKPSLDDAALATYDDPLARLTKAYRSKSKMLGTYFQPFLKTHADPNGLIHSDFFIHGTVSGRASCREPNLQNITRFEKFSSKTKTGSIASAIQSGLDSSAVTERILETRRAFVPRGPEYSLFFFDFAQMELRVFAEYAGEQFLLDTLLQGGDVHAATARKVFTNFPEKEKDPKLYEYFRQLAKQINFGIIYGMGRNKLAIQLNVPVDESVRAIELAQLAAIELPSLCKSHCTYTPQELASRLEDHRVMSASKQWEGLRALSREVAHKINPGPLEAELIKDGKHSRLLYSAEKFLANYHKQFPKIKQFTKAIQDSIGRRGYIFNKYGRRYHLKSSESYIGVNRLVQGSCADMVKLGQWRIDRLLLGKKTKLMNQVHDEVQVDVHRSELELIPKIKYCLEHFVAVNVKMEVDIDYSHTCWAEKRKWVSPEEFLTSDVRIVKKKPAKQRQPA